MKKNFTINPDDYQFAGLWRCNLFADWYWTTWLVSELAVKVSLELDEAGVLVINGGNYFTKKTVSISMQSYIKKIMSAGNDDILKKARVLAVKEYKRSIEQTKKLAKGKVDGENFTKIAELGRPIMFFWGLGYYLSEEFDIFLEPIAKKAGVKPENISSLVPPFRTPLMDAQLNLRKIKALLIKEGVWEVLLQDAPKAIRIIKKDIKLLSLFNEHENKHGWSNIMNLVESSHGIEQIIEQLTHIKNKEISSKLVTKRRTKEFELCLAVAADIAYLRQTGVEYFSMYSQAAMPYFKKVAKKLGLSYRELLDLSLDEIVAGLKGGEVKPLVKRRAGDQWLIISNKENEPIVIDNKKVISQLADKMIPRAPVGQKVVVGQIGNKGLARGVARIVLEISDFRKMKAGNVLVTTMTTPDYVMLMQKSAAIVTDIGGLLCHAAIISREINKPCVIGTKFATKIIKDGDLVEVDANSGVIKILNI